MTAPLTMHPDAEARIRARDAQCWVPERIGIDEPPWLVSARDRRRLLEELDATREALAVAQHIIDAVIGEEAGR